MRLPLIRSPYDVPKERRSADPFAPVSRSRTGGLPHWHESSLDLQRGLEVVEIFGQQERDHVHPR